MNTPQNHPDNTHDWHDALLDRGLAEIVGGETPPDLSEKILAAAQETPSVATLPDQTKRTTWRQWAGYVVAASLLIGTSVALMFPAINSAGSRPKNRDLAQVENTNDDDASRFVSKTEDPMMAVTPHIIIQEGAGEERLGIATEEEGDAQPLAPSATDPAQADEYLKGAVRGGGRGSAREPLSKDKLVEKVEQFNEFRDAQKFEEMERVAKDLYDAAPDEPVAQQVWENAKFIRRKMLDKELSNDSESGVLRTTGNNGGQSSVQASGPQPDHFYADVDAEPWGLSRAEDLRGRGESASTRVGDVPILGKVPSVARRFRNTGEEQDAEVYSFGLQFVPSHPSVSRDHYTPIHENPFVNAIGPDAVSTFSIDIDTASYANVRQFLTQSRQLPPPDAVRIEELINYFNYDYAGPTDDTPFAAHMEVAACPWNNEHRLARIAIKGKEIDRQARPQSNLVFLIDVSGSMNDPNKLPLLVEGMKLLTRELGENDRVAIVVYASTEGVVLESTRGDQQETILAALNRLQAGGSTAGGAGINRAYQIALDNFIEGATNRVILCTDGDFNVGVTGTDDLTRLAEQKAKTGVFLTVLGFGRGNLNDAMMESISGKGNGNYHYVDSLTEARKVLVEEMTGTLITIAKDVKIQVEFNPAKVAGHRLIGYENRMLATEDFNDDKKDAGEIGAGHTITALYEIIPAGKEVGTPAADPLKYQENPSPPNSKESSSGEANNQNNSGEGSSDLGEDDGFEVKGGRGGGEMYGSRGGYGGEYGGRGGEMMGGYGYGAGPAKPQAASNELLTLKLRYKLPDADKSTKLEFPITDKGGSFAESTKDFQFAAAVASFGMLLRHSQHQGETSFDAVSEIAQSAISNDPHGYRAEFLELVRIAKQLSGEQPSTTTDPSTTEGP